MPLLKEQKTKTHHAHIPGGIRTQVLLPAVILLLGALLLISNITLKITQRELLKQAKERALSHATLLVELLPAQNTEQILAYLPKHAQDSGIDFVGWKPADGHKLFASHQGELEDLGMEFIKTNSPRDPVTTRTYTLGHTTYLFTSLRSHQGQVILATDLRSVESSIQLARTSSYLFSLLTLTLLLVLGYAVFTFLVIRPLKTLGVATERASQGDFASPVSVISPNEFGRLAEQFNIMLQQLTQQRKQLLDQVHQLANANQELISTQQSLIHSEKLASIGQLAAGVAHEVGNPLAAVYGYAELLQDDDMSPEEVQMLASRICKQVDRIQRIIRELLDYSRSDTEEEFTLSMFDLHTCMSEAIELANTTGKTKDISIINTLNRSTPEVYGNPSQTLQVLLNLIINASDALHEQSQHDRTYTIQHRVNHEADALELRFIDNGPGIDDAHLHRIFDPFYTTKDPGKGTGLGLAISLRIMQRMHGSIELEHGHHPEFGGACFKLTFALSKPQKSQKLTPTPSQKP